MIYRYNMTTSDKHKYVWFRTSKCGTRSVLESLKNNTEINNPETCQKYDEKWNDYFKFTFIRNPWDRLLSCYKNKIDLGHIPIKKRRYYVNTLGVSNKKQISFKNFVRLMLKDEFLFADRHWSPLHSLIKIDSVDFIGRFENFVRQELRSFRPCRYCFLLVSPTPPVIL